jgi:hypothetical protein
MNHDGSSPACESGNVDEFSSSRVEANVTSYIPPPGGPLASWVDKVYKPFFRSFFRKKSRRSGFRSSLDLRGHRLAMMVSADPNNAFSSMKKGFTNLRAYGLGHIPNVDWSISGLCVPRYLHKYLSRDAALQISFLSRALPAKQLSRNAMERVVENYVSTLTEPVDEPRHPTHHRRLFDSISSVCRIMRQGGYTVPTKFSIPHESANSAFTVKQGGNRANIASDLYGLVPLPPKDLLTVPFPLIGRMVKRIFTAPKGAKGPNYVRTSFNHYKEMADDINAKLGCDPCDYCRRLEPHPNHGSDTWRNITFIGNTDLDNFGRKNPFASIPVPIMEYGWKLRWVSKSSPEVVAKNNFLREMVFPRLVLLPECRKTLRREISSQEFYFGRYRPRAKWYSIDFSTATDSLYLPVLRHAAQQLGVLGQWKAMPFHSTINGQQMTRGSLMGLGLSWTLLSVIHAAICRVVNRSSSGYSRQYASYIKGDDNVSYWTSSQYSLYCSLVDTVGLKLNSSKSFVSTDRAIFGEVILVPVNRNGFMYLIPETKFYSLRFLTKVSRVFSPSSYRQVPSNWILSIGDNLNRIRRSGRQAFLNKCFPGLASYLRNHPKYDPRLPLQLGGLGLDIGRSEELAPRWARVQCTRWHNEHRFPRSLFSLQATSETDKFCAKMLSRFETILDWYYPGSTDQDLLSKEEYEQCVTEIISDATYLHLSSVKFTPNKSRGIHWRKVIDRLRLRQKLLLNTEGFALDFSYGEILDYSKKILPTMDSVTKSWLGHGFYDEHSPDDDWVIVPSPRKRHRKRRDSITFDPDARDHLCDSPEPLDTLTPKQEDFPLLDLSDLESDYRDLLFEEFSDISNPRVLEAVNRFKESRNSLFHEVLKPSGGPWAIEEVHSILVKEDPFSRWKLIVDTLKLDLSTLQTIYFEPVTPLSPRFPVGGVVPTVSVRPSGRVVIASDDIEEPIEEERVFLDQSEFFDIDRLFGDSISSYVDSYNERVGNDPTPDIRRTQIIELKGLIDRLEAVNFTINWEDLSTQKHIFDPLLDATKSYDRFSWKD